MMVANGGELHKATLINIEHYLTLPIGVLLGESNEALKSVKPI